MKQNQTYDTQKFKMVSLGHCDFSLKDIEEHAYSFTTNDRRFFINIGDGYAIRRPKNLSNMRHISENNIIRIRDYYHKIIRAKNLKGHIICKKNRNESELKKVKLVKK